MKMKVISYFLIIISLVPAQGIEASWFGQAKSLFSAGVQWVKSSFSASQPAIQKRGLLTPHDFSGLYTGFKSEYAAMLSPLNGLALSENLTNLYLHGSPNSSFAQLLNSPKFGLLHYKDGVLHSTENKCLPGYSMKSLSLGTLAADIHLNRMPDEQWHKEFTARCKASHKNADARLSTTRIEGLIQALKGSKNESSDTPDRVSLYPDYYLPAIPAAMMMFKAKTKEDVISYIEALNNRMTSHGAESPLKENWAHLLQERFTDKDFEDSLQLPISRVITDEKAFETRFAAETDKRLNKSIIPQKVIQQSYGYKGGQAAANCAEAALQDLCNIILATPNGTFDVSLSSPNVKTA